MKIPVFKTFPNVNIKEFTRKHSDARTLDYINIMILISKRLNEQILVQAGFGLDLAVGEITRVHDDLDLIVQLDNLENAKDILIQEFTTARVGHFENKDPTRHFYIKLARSDYELHIDFEDLYFSSEEIYEKEESGKWNWPIKPTEFLWMRPIDNIPVYFISPRIIYLFKNWQSKRDTTRQKELDDFRTIERNFPEILEELKKDGLLK